MKHIYFYIWVCLANFHKFMTNLLRPIHTSIYKCKGKSKEDLKKWRMEYNESFLHFPGGLLDWFAFGLLGGICYIPIIIITVKLRIDIFTNKFLFGLTSITLFCFLYYIIYYRGKEWLNDKINKEKKKYFR